MRYLLTAMLVMSLVAATGAVVAQPADPVSRLKEGFGTPKPEPIIPPHGNVISGLASIMQRAHAGPLHPKFADQTVRGLLAETFIGGVLLDDGPKDPWAESHKHFQITSAQVESAAMAPGFVLVRVSGEAVGVPPLQQGRKPTIVPVLVQLTKDGKYRVGMGVAHQPETAGEKCPFDIVNERMPDADSAMLIFLNTADRTWAMYRDATSGKPKDQFLMVKIDEKTLIDLEARRVDAAKAAAAIAAKAAEQDVIDQAKAAQRIKQQGEQMEAAEQSNRAAIENAKFRKWTTMGGKYSVDAKIVSYANGSVTLERRDGKQIKVETVKLSDEDRTVIEKWRQDKRGAPTK